MDFTTRQRSLSGWFRLHHRLRKEYFRMLDEGGHAGSSYFHRIKREMGNVNDTIKKISSAG